MKKGLEDKNFLKRIEGLKKTIEEGDNERIHAIYDGLIYQLAKKHDNETVQLLDELVKDIDFWYA